MVAAAQFARSVIAEFVAGLTTWSKNNVSCSIKTFSYNLFKLPVYWICFICNTSPNGFGPASPRAFFSTLRQTCHACNLSVHGPAANDDEQRHTGITFPTISSPHGNFGIPIFLRTANSKQQKKCNNVNRLKIT
jgi:hypothetical protein